MIKEVTGDLIEMLDNGDVDIACHQANTQNVMGSGIAFHLKNKWPQVYEADVSAAKQKFNKLGNVSVATIARRGNLNEGLVINCYGQDLYGQHKRQTNYEALYKALEHAKLIAVSEASDQERKLVVGFPFKMSSDRAGADWNVVRAMIESVFGNIREELIETIIVKLPQ